MCIYAPLGWLCHVMTCLGYGNHMLGVYSVGMTPNWTSCSFFIMYTERQFNVLWHDGYLFSMDGAEVEWYPSSVPPILV